MTWDRDAEHMPSGDRLKELLVGKSIVTVSMGTGYDPVGLLTLSDGTHLQVWGNDGGCSCNSGCYPLTLLNGCENVITNVEVEDHPAGDGSNWADYQGWYRIFVWAEEQRVNLATFEGTDGNGYYGTGWWLKVVK